MKSDFCRLRQLIAAWGFRPGLWLGLCLCLFCCSVLPARALELVDSRGVTVRLERPAQRIIALYGAFNEILLALDARETLVARTAADAAIPGLQDLPAVGTHMRPNAELVAARQPDVVLQLAGRQEVLTQTEALEAVGIPVLVYEMQSFEQLFAVTRALGRLTGRETRAEALVADWQRRLAVLEQRYAGSRLCACSMRCVIPTCWLPDAPASWTRSSAMPVAAMYWTRRKSWCVATKRCWWRWTRKPTSCNRGP
jgi:iron complex transport system substrate-binding protein